MFELVPISALDMCVVVIILAFTQGYYAYYVAIALTFFFGEYLFKLNMLLMS